jgi:hypothetical protein
VLEIAVERDHGGTTRGLETPEEGRLMSEVAAEADQTDSRILGTQLANALRRPVRRSVIDEDDFQKFRSP